MRWTIFLRIGGEIVKNYKRIAEVLEDLPVSEATFRRWLRDGLIRSTRVGRVRFVDVEDLERVLSGTKQRNTA
jgi:excisionase family DNA binding protein